MAPKTMTLTTSGGETFHVSAAAAAKLRTIRRIMEAGCIGNGETIEVPVVAGEIFAVVVEWAEKHADAAATAEEVKQWEAKLVKEMDERRLYHLLLCADFLDADELVELLTEKVASLIRGKTVEKVRETFKIKNTVSGEQEVDSR